MRDAAIVASIVAGDLAGLAEAYDRYADPLFSYCRFMLDDPADAADAVEDTFLTADARLGRLRDPQLLRPWLYAVARNECVRQLRARSLSPARSPGPARRPASAGAGPAVPPAVRALGFREREVVGLRLGQDLELAEVALATGASRHRVRSLLSRARDRVGMTSAEALAAMMAESTRLAGGAPAGLQDHVLWTATSQDDEALSHQGDVRGRARAFRLNGFPRPVPLPESGWRRSPQGLARLAAGATATAVAVLVTLALTLNWQPTSLAGPHPVSTASPQPTVGAPAAATPIVPVFTPVAPTPSTSATRKAAKAPVLAAKQSHPAAKHPATGPAAAGKARHRTAPAPTASPPPAGAPAPSSPPTSAKPTPPPPVPGTLAVSPSSLNLSRDASSGTITLTAENGPVTWSVTQTGGGPALDISPAEGSLPAGQQVQVTVSVGYGTSSFSTELEVGPGNQTVTVTYSRHRGAH